MIIRFSVKNFRSYKNENVLNFVSSSKIKKFPEHERRFGRLSVVKNIGILGSNAFGKSNYLNALGAMINLITRGFCHENMAFIDSPNEPTEFDIVFLHNDNQFYEYSFSIKKENFLNPYVVIDERLYRLYLNGNSDVIYTSQNGLKNNNSGPLKYYEEGYKNIKNELFLKYINAPERFVENNEISKLLKSIYVFFLTNIVVKLNDSPMFYLINKQNIKKITSYLKKYDMGIEKVEFSDLSDSEIRGITRDPIIELIRSEFQKKPSLKEQYFTNGKDIYVVTNEEHQYKIQKLLFKHKGIETPFCFGYESDGTKRIFTLLALLLDENNVNKTIVIDEIERSAFSSIASELITDFQEMFKDSNAQLLFTTHLTSLIDSVLRRDEIYFVTKNASGESNLYSLMDFKTTTRENIEKNFLDGAFGGIPRIKVRI